MSVTLLRKLPRWFAGALPAEWEKAVVYLRRKLLDLESTLSALLGEAEGMAAVLGREDTGDVTLLRGSLRIEATGAGLKVQSGGGADRAGTAVLVAGTTTVNTTAAGPASTCLILLTGQTSSGVHGEITISARVVGTSFTILSNNAGDTRTVGWFIVELI
jgi:hypothetical protein